MRRHRKKLALLLASVIACALYAIFSGKPEPAFKGHPLSEWIALYSGRHGRVPTPEEKQEPAEAIRNIGTNALPCLLAWLDYEPAGWRYKVGSISQKLPGWIVKSRPMQRMFNTDEAGERAEQALDAFTALGEAAGPAAPELIRRIHLTNSPAIQDRAMLALAHIGPQAVPTMKELLSDPREAGSLWLMACINTLGTNARPLVPTLIRNLQDTNWFTAMISARTLGELNFDPQLEVPALTRSLSDPRHEVRMETCLALARFGKDAVPALPALSNALNDPDPDVRGNAGRALADLAPYVPTNALTH